MIASAEYTDFLFGFAFASRVPNFLALETSGWPQSPSRFIIFDPVYYNGGEYIFLTIVCDMQITDWSFVGGAGFFVRPDVHHVFMVNKGL